MNEMLMRWLPILLTFGAMVGGYALWFADRSYYPNSQGITMAANVESIKENQRKIVKSLEKTNKGFEKNTEVLKELKNQLQEVKDDLEKQILRDRIERQEKQIQELERQNRGPR